jgi:hypothetical protein
MTAPPALSVRLDETDDAVATTHRAVLAGLASRWRIGHATTDAAVVFGGHHEWPSRASEMLERGVRGLLITGPVWTQPAAVAKLAQRAEASGTHVAVESRFLTDPSWKQILPSLRDRAADAVLVDSLRVVPRTASAAGDERDLGAHCLEQLAVVTTVLGPLPTFPLNEQSDGQYLLSVTSADRAVNVVGIRGGSGSGRLIVDLVGPDARWRIRFDDGALARPTTVETTDASGTHATPPIFETGRRGAWVELHNAITSALPVSYDLALLAACMRLAASTGGVSASMTSAVAE